MSLPTIPTVRVDAPEVVELGYMLINTSDFDPSTMRLHESEADVDARARQEKYDAERGEEYRRSDQGRVEQLLALAAPEVIRAVEEAPASEAVLALLELAEAGEKSGKNRVTVIRALERREGEIRESLKQSRRLIAEAEKAAAERERLEAEAAAAAAAAAAAGSASVDESGGPENPPASDAPAGNAGNQEPPTGSEGAEA